jgi:molecular chaperone GrpE (heat shock protein)
MFGGTHQSIQKQINRGNTSGMGPEEEGKTQKLEENMKKLNSDLLNVNEEIENLKNILLRQQPDYQTPLNVNLSTPMLMSSQPAGFKR